jgi:hypothetical protein
MIGSTGCCGACTVDEQTTDSPSLSVQEIFPMSLMQAGLMVLLDSDEYYI